MSHDNTGALARYEEAQKEYENFGRCSYDFLRSPIYHSTKMATIHPATGNSREHPQQVSNTVQQKPASR